ncbi:MAG: hypothetical protein JWQ76_1217 [Ramlibacter sp.]|nr:hypothetical protein [Ramlibacter sp.]
MSIPSRALAVLLLSALGACQPPPPRQLLDREGLQLQLRSLASAAAEAGLMTQQLADRRLSGGFAWVEQQGLGEDAARAAAELARPAGVELRPAQREAMQLAASLQLELNQVAAARHDGSALGALEARFGALRTQAQRLERAL